MNGRRSGIRILFSTAALVLVASSLIQAADDGKPVNDEALRYAFRFASAIEADPKDMARAQQAVLMEYVATGNFAKASQLVGQVQGWNQGIAQAELAMALARSGQADKARHHLAKAREVQSRTQGWHSGRIGAHIAKAMAAMGDLEGSRKLIRELAASDDVQYGGQATATVATAHLARGDYENAMKELGTLDGDKDIYRSWWRTAGYMAIARKDDLPREQRLIALDTARRSAQDIVDWKRAETLESIAKEYFGLGEKVKAREAMETAEERVIAIPTTNHLRPALLSNLARSWADLGEVERARKLLKEAEPGIADTQNTQQAGIYANLATSYHSLGDRAESRRLLIRALDQAATLANSRPRALALVTVCRLIGRNGMTLDGEIRSRLDSLYAGLGDPW